jgi:DNA-binding CsgD family transcriptional regulator
MQKHQVIAGFDHNARLLHMFHALEVDLPFEYADALGEPLGSYAATETDAREVRAAFAECLFTGLPQKSVITTKSLGRFQFQFEKVVHKSQQTLRPDDEVAVLALISPEPTTELEITPREQEILELICQDLTNAEVAKRLKISESTVETHRQNIRQKLGARGIAGVVVTALRWNLIELD